MTMVIYNNKVYVKDESLDDMRWNRDAIAKSAHTQKTIIAPALMIGSVLIKYAPIFYFSYQTTQKASEIYDNYKDSIKTQEIEFFKTFTYAALTAYSIYSVNAPIVGSLALGLDYAVKAELESKYQIKAYNDAIEEMILGKNNFVLEC